MSGLNIKNYTKTSIFMSKVLRHDPDSINIDMDKHGWVDTLQLIDRMNTKLKHPITFEELEFIVANDEKQRYKFNSDKSRIKACQGHSIPWVEPELTYDLSKIEVPEYVYHGTNTEAMQLIYKSGCISKMKRHAVHMHADIEMARKSAKRWHGKNPVVLVVSVEKLISARIRLGVSDNDVWCADVVPVDCIVDKVYN